MVLAEFDAGPGTIFPFFKFAISQSASLEAVWQALASAGAEAGFFFFFDATVSMRLMFRRLSGGGAGA
jgi:hypothetical protein